MLDHKALVVLFAVRHLCPDSGPWYRVPRVLRDRYTLTPPVWTHGVRALHAHGLIDIAETGSGHAGRSMVRLVDELVDLERLSLGVMAVEHRTVAVTELCRTLAARYRVAAPDQPITVTGDECDASADEGRVDQVLVGLIANALRYTRTPIEIDVHRTGDRVVVTVADHGPGIPAHLRERAFVPFDRLDRTDRGGAGLGLAVAKRLVEAMDGTITLADTPGGGLTVVIDLPAA